MKKILLLSAIAASAIAANGVALQTVPVKVEKASESIMVGHVKPVKANAGARKVAPGVTLSVAGNSDLKVKRVNSTLGMTRMLPGVKAPVAKSSRAPQRLSEGFSLEESFEGWDGTTLPWVPENWTLDSKTGKTGVEATTWGPSTGLAMMGVVPVDGDYCMAIGFDVENPSAQQDEWLISPELTIKEHEQLEFYSYIDPFFLFSLDNFDWDSYDWVGDRVVTYTLKVMVREENAADWVEIWDASTPWMETEVMDLLSSSPSGLQKYTVQLSQFAGKKVKIAFQFVGKDTNSLYLDMVTVGLPQLDDVVYDDPAETLYWGFDRSADWRSLNASIAQYPVYAPVTWSNATYHEGATFQWEYCDPVTADWVTSNDDNLTVTYIPDYSSEASTRNNWFYAPKLHATAPGATPGMYQAPYSYFQAGGKPEREVSVDGNKELIDFGLSHFANSINGLGFVAMEADFGENATPIFGYDKNVEKWWLNYTYNGDLEDAFESDNVYVEAIINMIFPGTSPMVINGANLLAKGQISANAEFKLEIIALDEEMVPMFDSPLATATCKGDKMLMAEGGVQNFYNIIFDFDQPVVIEPGTNGYLARVSGFHDAENVTYFAPMQSMIPFTHANVIAWIDKFIKIQGAEEYKRSLTPIFHHESEYGMCHNAFAINLSAYHPWLESETKEIEVPADGTPVEVKLDSYHDAAALTVEAPAGVTATVSGRYGQCKLVVSHNNADVIAEGNLTITGPGVKKVFAVSESAGIDGVIADGNDNAVPVAAFTVTGQRVALEDAVKGVYILKYSNGKAEKVAVK